MNIWRCICCRDKQPWRHLSINNRSCQFRRLPGFAEAVDERLCYADPSAEFSRIQIQANWKIWRILAIYYILPRFSIIRQRFPTTFDAFIRSFVRSFIHSFMHLFICCRACMPCHNDNTMEKYSKSNSAMVVQQDLEGSWALVTLGQSEITCSKFEIEVN